MAMSSGSESRMKGEVVLGGEFLVGGHAVLADADDNHILCPELFVACGKGAGLPCTAGGVVPGIEIYHNFFTCKIRQRHGVSVFVL